MHYEIFASVYDEDKWGDKAYNLLVEDVEECLFFKLEDSEDDIIIWQGEITTGPNQEMVLLEKLSTLEYKELEITSEGNKTVSTSSNVSTSKKNIPINKLQAGKQLSKTKSRKPEDSFKVKLYRAGKMQKVSYEGEVLERFSNADQVLPEGRLGRTTGLFASSSMNSLGVWVKANFWCGGNYDPTPWEINYEGVEPYIYPIIAWNSASSRNTPEAYKEYWESGILLKDYLNPDAEIRKVIESHLWRDGGEILIDPENCSYKPISFKRLINNVDEFLGKEIKDLAKRTRGLVIR